MNYILAFTALAVVVASCNQGESSRDDAASASATNEILFSDQAVVEYAKHFQVSYHENYKVDKVFGEFEADGEKELKHDVLVLVQKGTEAPSLTDGLAGAHVISIPVEDAAVNVQHAESFLRELGLVHRLVAVGGVVSYDDSVRQKAIDGRLGQVGYIWHSPPNLEVLLTRQSGIFFMTFADLGHANSLEKCRELGIATAPVFDWAEKHYLGRAEWIKFYSLFFNKEQEATLVFNEIRDRISELQSLVSERQTNAESVMWEFYTDKGRWVVRLATDEVLFSKDAGMLYPLADVLLPNPLGATTVSTEELIEKAGSIDHWVIGDIHSAKLLPEYIMNSFKAWKSGKLYHNMKRGKPEVNASDWYATGLVRPDYILADMVKLMHPDLLPEHELFFMGIFDKKTEFPVLRSMR